MTNYVFDVDGTLTASRQAIDAEFAGFFMNFISKHTVYLASGSDLVKTQEQLGDDICNAVAGIFSCAGNVFYQQGKEVYRNDFELADDEYQLLENILMASAFPIRTGQHIEKRIGLVNFSIVGRGAGLEQREEYIKWDTRHQERIKIAQALTQKLTRFDCGIAGETGIDIYLKGFNKRQVADHVARPLVFFGDRCEPGGNDYPLGQVADMCYAVKDWCETWKILQQL